MKHSFEKHMYISKHFIMKHIAQATTNEEIQGESILCELFFTDNFYGC